MKSHQISNKSHIGFASEKSPWNPPERSPILFILFFMSICPFKHHEIHHHEVTWLVVWTPLKNISQLGWLFPIYGKIKNVPNHQPVTICALKSPSKFPWTVAAPVAAAADHHSRPRGWRLRPSNCWSLLGLDGKPSWDDVMNILDIVDIWYICIYWKWKWKWCDMILKMIWYDMIYIYI